MEIVLGIVAGMAIAGCVWLLIGRGRLLARAAEAAAQATGAAELHQAELEQARQVAEERVRAAEERERTFRQEV